MKYSGYMNSGLVISLWNLCSICVQSIFLSWCYWTGNINVKKKNNGWVILCYCSKGVKTYSDIRMHCFVCPALKSDPQAGKHVYFQWLTPSQVHTNMWATDTHACAHSDLLLLLPGNRSAFLVLVLPNWCLDHSGWPLLEEKGGNEGSKQDEREEAEL